MEGIQYKSLIIKLVDKQRFITENPCVTGSIPVGTTQTKRNPLIHIELADLFYRLI